MAEQIRTKQNVHDIPILYKNLMEGYTGEKAETSFQLKDDGSFPELYAPGYDNNGVAEISATCL